MKPAVVRCVVCGRRLTAPESVKREMGPVCKRKQERIQKLDYFQELSPDTAGYAVEDVVVPPSFEPELPTCPSCGKASPNPRYCPSCGSPMRARPLEVAA